MLILSADPHYLIYRHMALFVAKECRGGLGVMVDFHRVAALDIALWNFYNIIRTRLQHGRA